MFSKWLLDRNEFQMVTLLDRNGSDLIVHGPFHLQRSEIPI